MFQRVAGESEGFAQVLTNDHPRNGELSSWKWDYPVGAGEYAALFPKSWFDYKWDKFPAHVVLEQFSPVLPETTKNRAIRRCLSLARRKHHEQSGHCFGPAFLDKHGRLVPRPHARFSIRTEPRQRESPAQRIAELRRGHNARHCLRPRPRRRHSQRMGRPIHYRRTRIARHRSLLSNRIPRGRRRKIRLDSIFERRLARQQRHLLGQCRRENWGRDRSSIYAAARRKQNRPDGHCVGLPCRQIRPRPQMEPPLHRFLWCRWQQFVGDRSRRLVARPNGAMRSMRGKNLISTKTASPTGIAQCCSTNSTR